MNDIFSYYALKDRQRVIRDGFPSNLGLRVHRAIRSVPLNSESRGDTEEVL